LQQSEIVPIQCWHTPLYHTPLLMMNVLPALLTSDF